MEQPWLSVIMPVYNGGNYLPAALDGIVAQKESEIEVLAIDDGSTDNSVEILKEYTRKIPLRIIQRPHIGNWVANTNHGLAVARGKYVCFLHQDDLWLKGRLGNIKRLIARVPEATLFLHPSWYIDETGRRVGLWQCPLSSWQGGLKPNLVLKQLLIQNFISMPGPLFPRQVALEVGGLDESLWYTADWDFWLKIAALGKTVYLPKPLSAFRIHSFSQTALHTNRTSEIRHQLETVLEKHLARSSSSPAETSVIKVARFAVEANLALASWAHGLRPDWKVVVHGFLGLGPDGWRRFFRDSRILERVQARLQMMGRFSIKRKI